jgi:hypothetical protein
MHLELTGQLDCRVELWSLPVMLLQDKSDLRLVCDSGCTDGFPTSLDVDADCVLGTAPNYGVLVHPKLNRTVSSLKIADNETTEGVNEFGNAIIDAFTSKDPSTGLFEAGG